MKNRFLIVDDDALVLRATARLVEHITGFETDCCASGEEALRVFRADPGGFAAVVTDFCMPGMNGLELGDCLRALAPGVRMLLVTGSPGALCGADVARHGFDCVLVKPFDLATMAEALRPILLSINDVAREHPDAGASFLESRVTLPAAI